MNGFDMLTHLFSILPISISYYYGETLICIFIIIAALISLIYHSDETNKEFHHLDHFFSSSLIILTFILYLEHAYKLTVVSLVLLAAFVIIEYVNDINIIEWFVGVVIVASIAVFFYEKYRDNPSRRFDYKNFYFLGFFFTQLLAVGFFVWDQEPYAHSFWHLFAFTSLGAVLAHTCSLTNESPKTPEDMEFDRTVFYWLGSVPSRLYISYVLLDWASTSNTKAFPVAITFLLLAVSMVVQRKSFHARTKATSYSIIAGVMFFGDHIDLAGGILVADTILSAAGWFTRKEEKKETHTYTKVKKIELAELVF